MTKAYQEIAYDEGVRSIESQERTLEALRGRAGGVLAAASIVTSFLGGQALAKPALSGRKVVLPPIGVAGWFAIGAFVVVAVLTVAILWPYKWRFAMGASTILAHGPNMPDSLSVYAKLAGFHHNNLKTNRAKLELLFWAFRVQCLGLLLTTTLWLVDLRT
jgi:hypothetical protein